MRTLQYIVCLVVGILLIAIGMTWIQPLFGIPTEGIGILSAILGAIWSIFIMIRLLDN